MSGTAFYDTIHEELEVQRKEKKQMTVAEAIRAYVNEIEGLELYEQEPEKEQEAKL